MMDVSGKHSPSEHQSTATWESVGEKRPAETEIEMKTWGETHIPVQRLRLHGSGMQREHQDFLYSPGDTDGQPRLRNPKKDSLDNTHPFMENSTGKPVCCGIVK